MHVVFSTAVLADSAPACTGSPAYFGPRTWVFGGSDHSTLWFGAVGDETHSAALRSLDALCRHLMNLARDVRLSIFDDGVSFVGSVSIPRILLVERIRRLTDLRSRNSADFNEPFE